MSTDLTAAYAYDGLDRIIHEKARLSIMTSLIAHPKGLAFADLKTLCALTDGNLSRHLRILEEAGFVSIHKRFEGKRPLTTTKLTATGRQRFIDYLKVLENVVQDAASATRSASLSLPAKPKPT